MKTFRYHVNAYFNQAETTLRTNDIRIAIREFFDYIEDDVQCDITDGTTGEVLAIANNPDMENYTTEEMALMMLGVLAEDAWGHAEAEEAECIDCECDDEEITDESLVMALVNELAGNCSAIKCKICGLPS